MSLILDALKKSEAERQLGRAPGLMSPMVRVSRRRGVSPWWGVLGLAIAVAAGAAWWIGSQPAREAATASSESRDAAMATGASRDAAATASRESRNASESAVSTSRNASESAASISREATGPATPASRDAATAPGDRDAASRASATAREAPPALSTDPPIPEPVENAALLPRDPEFDSVEREATPIAAQATPTIASTVPPLPASPPVAQSSPSAPATVASSETSPTVDTAITGPDASPTADTTVASSDTLPTVDTAVAGSDRLPTVDTTFAGSDTLPTVDTAVASPAPAPTAPAAAAEPPLEPLPTVAELTADVRNALPPLKMSMHAYGDSPSARFALIDGKRYAPGDRINASLVLEAIRRDGAVLDAGGQRFLLPRP